MHKHCGSNTVRIEDGEGIYLFCFARLHQIPVQDMAGPDDFYSVYPWTFMGVTAILSKVSLDEYCGPSAESRIRDLSWIGPRACRHENIVERVMCHSPVVPARFGTIFSSMNRLKDLLKVHGKTILNCLDQVADKQEWAVKGLIDMARAKEKLVSEITAAEAQRLALLAPGARYFQEKRIHNHAGSELNCLLKEIYKETADDLSALASDVCPGRLLSKDASGTDMDMFMNTAYLVPLNCVKAFHARVDRANAVHAQNGLVFKLSGPWPPYSFCPCFEIEDGN
jgi:hypothetical protein